jgi:hypothetical protein
MTVAIFATGKQFMKLRASLFVNITFRPAGPALKGERVLYQAIKAPSTFIYSFDPKLY